MKEILKTVWAFFIPRAIISIMQYFAYILVFDTLIL